MINFKKSICYIILFFKILDANAQELNQYKIPVSVKIESSSFNKDRDVIIYLPKDYEKTEVAYPVLYVLDGHRQELKNLVASTANYFSTFNTIPQFILVFVPQVNRGYELNPAIPNNKNPNIGGADKFLSYLGDLKKYLGLNYRTASFNLIYGHSLGASFATYALIKEPDLFNAYILASPNYTFNKEYYIQQMQSIINNNSESLREKFVYLTLGDQWSTETNFRTSTLKMDSIFTNLKSLRYHFRDNKLYGHNTTPSIAIVDGLSQIFANYWKDGANVRDSIFDQKADVGMLTKAYFKRLSDFYGYEIAPKPDHYQYWIVAQYLKNKDIDNSIKYLQESLSYYPNNTSLLISYGEALFMKKNISEAIKIYKLAITKTNDREIINDLKKRIRSIKLKENN